MLQGIPSLLHTIIERKPATVVEHGRSQSSPQLTGWDHAHSDQCTIIARKLFRMGEGIFVRCANKSGEDAMSISAGKNARRTMSGSGAFVQSNGVLCALAFVELYVLRHRSNVLRCDIEEVARW